MVSHLSLLLVRGRYTLANLMFQIPNFVNDENVRGRNAHLFISCHISGFVSITWKCSRYVHCSISSFGITITCKVWIFRKQFLEFRKTVYFENLWLLVNNLPLKGAQSWFWIQKQWPRRQFTVTLTERSKSKCLKDKKLSITLMTKGMISSPPPDWWILLTDRGFCNRWSKF